MAAAGPQEVEEIEGLNKPEAEGEEEEAAFDAKYEHHVFVQIRIMIMFASIVLT